MMKLVKPAPLRKCTEYAVCKILPNFVSDPAAGIVKIVSPLTAGTVSFLQTLGKLYDSFGISAQTVDAVSLSLQDSVNNVSSHQ